MSLEFTLPAHTSQQHQPIKTYFIPALTITNTYMVTCKIYTLLCHTGKTINRLFYYHSVMHRLKTLHVRLLVANCADERGQTDRQKDIQTDRQTDRQRDIQTDRQTDWHTDSTLSLDRTGLFHHCWASPAAVGQILSKIILSYPPGLFTERGAPHFWKDTKLSFFKAILLMVMLHKVA